MMKGNKELVITFREDEVMDWGNLDKKIKGMEREGISYSNNIEIQVVENDIYIEFSNKVYELINDEINVQDVFEEGHSDPFSRIYAWHFQVDEELTDKRLEELKEKLESMTDYEVLLDGIYMNDLED